LHIENKIKLKVAQIKNRKEIIMANLNKVLLIGNLTNDPEVKYTKSGNPVASFGLAVNRKYKRDDEEIEEVCYLNIVAWNRLAEVCAEYLTKGKSVFVEGRLNQNKWEEQDGGKRSRLEVVAKTVQFLSPKDEATPLPEEDEDEVAF